MSQFLGIENINEFYGDHYLAAIAESDVAKVAERWKDLNGGSPTKRLANLHREFFARRDEITAEHDLARRIEALQTHAAHVLEALGYTVAPQLQPLEGKQLPLLAMVRRADGAQLMWAITAMGAWGDEAPPLARSIPREQAQRLTSLSERAEADVPSGTIEDIVTAAFDLEEPPRCVLVLSESDVYLCERSKWAEQRLLRFDLGEILGRRDEPTLQLTAALLHKTSLAPDEGPVVLDDFDDNSHKHAFAVSEDLKYALRECIELLGNEAVRQLRERHARLFTEDRAAQLARECMRYMYRLLFLFYVEARPELGWAPLGVPAWTKGYGLERLRSFEQTELLTEEDKSGTYLHDSLSLLFRMVFEGAKPAAQHELRLSEEATSLHGVFQLAPLKSHLFDPARTPLLETVQFPNHVLQQVIEKMSLSRAGSSKRRGRISYATLGISQLGAVYEALLSFRGFFAREPLYELYPNGETPGPLKPAWFVTEAQLSEYSEEERLGKAPKGGSRPGLKKYAPGTFIYRMSGRDRQKSASYYTPQSLTKATVEYTLQEILFDEDGKEKLSADEILNLTVLEPAAGSAAFLNEAIDQLAEAYLHRKQRELGLRIPHDKYVFEKQRVKMYIADRNVFGIDLNPIAIELAEVSLWLNTIHAGAYVPWFGTQLVRGNSLIGGRRDVWLRDQVIGEHRAWLSDVPTRVRVGEPRPEGAIWHFLLPDQGMAVYGEGTEGKPIRERYKAELAKIDAWRSASTSPLDDDDHQALVDLSAAIDQLWDAHVDELRAIRKRTTDPMAIYGRPALDGKPTTTAEKDTIFDQELASTGVKASSPYRRLKLAMDYWCALWFWPIEHAHLLPTRGEMIADLMLLLDSSLVQEDTTKPGEARDLFATTRPQAEAQKLVQELGFVDVPRLLDKRPRLRLADELAERYGFLHQELEFADTFADRGGFDVIVGNPPWIKLEWSEGNVLSDIDPAFALRDLNAGAISKRRDLVFETPGLREMWTEEHEFASGAQSFLAATQNYPELRGQAPNLYKCFLPQAWRNERSGGAAGFLHPDGGYDDPRARVFRRAAFSRLRRHYHFINELKLFAEPDHHTEFSINVYSTPRTEPRFFNIANLFRPDTIRTSHEHAGQGIPPGIKDEENRWAVSGHKDRVIQIGIKELALFAQLYDGEGVSPTEARLPALHSQRMVPTLRRFAESRSLGEKGIDYYAHDGFNEARAVRAGTLREETAFPSSLDEVVLSGPHLFVATPLYKTPRRICTKNSHYDAIDLTAIPDDYIPRTNFAIASKVEYAHRTPRVMWAVDGQQPRLTELFRVATNRGIDPRGERTLQPVIIPPGPGHIDGVYSYAFPTNRQVVMTAATWATILVDFFVKTTGAADFRPSLGSRLPASLGAAEPALSRALGLNCLTRYYVALWSDVAVPGIGSGDGWTRDDPRLDDGWFTRLSRPWRRESALRTDYARRQALVELDVLIAIRLGMSFDELRNIYRAQFPIMREYERDTRYDRRGRIVFTNSRGLTGVGLSRKREKGSDIPGWEDVKDMKSGTFDVIIEDDTMPGGPIQRTITYEAPFDRCDREADYALAWAEFKRRGL